MNLACNANKDKSVDYYEEEKRAHELFGEKKYKEVVNIYEAILKDPNSAKRTNLTEGQRISFFIKETDNYYEHLSSIPNAPVYFNKTSVTSR